MGKNSNIGGDDLFATLSPEHYFTLAINKSIDINNQHKIEQVYY